MGPLWGWVEKGIARCCGEKKRAERKVWKGGEIGREKKGKDCETCTECKRIKLEKRGILVVKIVFEIKAKSSETAKLEMDVLGNRSNHSQ